ncbi:MAG: DNA-3-methyladenine glycosylase [Alphaproteobacteria bacterium]|nr:DNA-3-methyladenine glycosylase [Alphaproteobacteria bacterium]
MNRLDRAFFNRPTLKVAKELLGKVLVFGEHQGTITETEAYIGLDDPASHAAKGKTKRNEIMFGEAGFAYVYLIYGMYNCLNFVTEKKDFPAAVLIRGLKVISNPPIIIDGPGKLCRFLGITREQNNTDIITSENFYVADSKNTVQFEAMPRIGISSGTDRLWRFIAKP